MLGIGYWGERALGYWSASLSIDSRVFALCKGVSFQPLGDTDGAVLLVIETGQLYSCNVTTARFLQATDGVRSFAQVVDVVCKDFEVSREELHSDLSGTVGELVAEGLVEQVAAQP
jgi:Coenzyme PQQ synthesis protein D (PqqD)